MAALAPTPARPDTQAGVRSDPQARPKPMLMAVSTAWVRFLASRARRIAVMWIFTVPTAMLRRWAISLFGQPRANSSSTSRWRGVRLPALAGILAQGVGAWIGAWA